MVAGYYRSQVGQCGLSRTAKVHPMATRAAERNWPQSVVGELSQASRPVLRRRGGLVCAAAVGFLLASTACGMLDRQVGDAPATPGSVANPVISPPGSTGPVVEPGEAVGYLEGRASIGPLQPVERVGVPRPTPPPAVCTARGLVVYDARSGAQVTRFAFGPDCNYRIDLPAGSYRIELDARGIDHTTDLPRILTVLAGQTTRLDISIDTGIR